MSDELLIKLLSIKENYMNKEDALKIAIISGLIVAAITIFVYTPLSEKIFKRDSSVKIIAEENENIANETNEQNVIVDKKTNGVTRENISNKGVDNQMQSENFSSYINTSITNSSGKTNIAITVVDENGNISSSISSSIANVYNQTNNTGNTGLLKSSFIHQSGFQELLEGNSEIIEKLKLNNYADYIAIGRIRYLIRKGILADGTFVCTASITMSIISTSQKSIAKSFSFSEKGNGATEIQAQEAATEKLINKYYNEYSSL